jgi:hypothetical protein
MLMNRIKSIVEPTPLWDVAIVCEDSRTAGHAQWLLREILPSTGLNVRYNTRVHSLGRVPAVAMIRAAIQEAFDADLVVVSTYGSGGACSDDELLGQWWSMPGGQLCPVAVAIVPADGSGSSRYEFLTALQRWQEHPDCPILPSFSDALLGAWGHWRLKARAFAAAHTTFVRIDSETPVLSPGQATAAKQNSSRVPKRVGERIPGERPRVKTVRKQRSPQLKGLLNKRRRDSQSPRPKTRAR